MKPLRIILIAVITVLVMLGVRRWVGEPFYIASDSMAPALTRGDHLFLINSTGKKLL